MAEKSSKLKKLKMPEDSGADKGDDVPGQESDMDLQDDESDSADMPEEVTSKGPSPELDHVSDDDLIAEAKKRGLKVEQEGSPEEEAGESPEEEKHEDDTGMYT